MREPIIRNGDLESLSRDIDRQESHRTHSVHHSKKGRVAFVEGRRVIFDKTDNGPRIRQIDSDSGNAV